MTDRAAADRLREGLSELGRALGDLQEQQLLELAELLAAWAPRMNLTAHRSAQDIVRRLVLDALAMEPELPPAETLVDLGSGAGFPGLPLAVLRPGTALVLVEARERRHHFQRAAVRALGLGNVRTLRGRIEQLEPEPAKGVVAQALAKPHQAVAWARRWCQPGGWIAIPGSSRTPDPGPVEGVRAEPSRRYRVPLSETERTLWLGRRSTD